MDIKKLNEFLLRLDYYYYDGERVELREIDNKIDELTELLNDAIKKGLGDSEDMYDDVGRVDSW
jgi:hypothetical protein|tara:strand:- start:23 stop:214 length:192 start_codon:yes stop_codon:yes gene_type:complete